MILKGSQRSGGQQLGLHLLKTEENEHVEVHEVSGFVSETVLGAMKEAHALSLGTRCKQYLFSVSLNPPPEESVPIDVFEDAVRRIEEANGLVGHPRLVVFHEKEGRRHAHAVWSRIDADTMTAKGLDFFKSKLMRVAKQLYLDNGWAMPKGFVDKSLRDPRNFSLDDWQQAKRADLNPAELKAAVQECWKLSDNRAAFTTALEERGLFLAKGDRRGHVVVTIEGDVFPISRLVGIKAQQVINRLGDPDHLPTVKQMVDRLAGEVGTRLKGHIREAKHLAAIALKPLLERRDELKIAHRHERHGLDASQRERFVREQRERSSRIRTGAKGMWDILTGRYFKPRKANEAEALAGVHRDRAQRHNLLRAQAGDRRKKDRGG